MTTAGDVALGHISGRWTRRRQRAVRPFTDEVWNSPGKFKTCVLQENQPHSSSIACLVTQSAVTGISASSVILSAKIKVPKKQ